MEDGLVGEGPDVTLTGAGGAASELEEDDAPAPAPAPVPPLLAADPGRTCPNGVTGQGAQLLEKPRGLGALFALRLLQ